MTAEWMCTRCMRSVTESSMDVAETAFRIHLQAHAFEDSHRADQNLPVVDYCEARPYKRVPNESGYTLVPV